MKTGILLINLGTPDSPSVSDVRKYLTQFLNDPLVIDINPVARFFLVNFIIVPFRAKKSAELYQKIWTKNGSPLLIHTKNLTQKLQHKLETDFIVEFGMRYQNPSIHSAFRKLKNQNAEKILAIPLYPQYASSSTGSTIQELKKIMKKENFFNVKIMEYFFHDEQYINSMAETARKYLLNEYDFFLFSYHGLPERQIFKECKRRWSAPNAFGDGLRHSAEKMEAGSKKNFCSSISDCETSEFRLQTSNYYCYRASCYETTRQLVKKLNIPEGKYETSFQSRLDDKWLRPYSDRVIEELGKKGVKKLLVFSPAFVADCLETIYEIGVEYEEIFKKNGGEKLQLAESLNDSEVWVNALSKMIQKFLTETE